MDRTAAHAQRRQLREWTVDECISPEAVARHTCELGSLRPVRLNGMVGSSMTMFWARAILRAPTTRVSLSSAGCVPLSLYMGPERRVGMMSMRCGVDRAPM